MINLESGMNNEDKALLDLAKQILKVESYKEIAVMIGSKENTVINWSNRGLSKLARLKINQLINNENSQKNNSKITIPNQINSHISNIELEILEAYRELPKVDQEIFYFKIKGAAAEARKKSEELHGASVEDVKSAG
jgi:hypothetical protein